MIEGGFADLKENGSLEPVTFVPSPCVDEEECLAKIEYLRKLEGDEFLVFHSVINAHGSDIVACIVVNRQTPNRELVPQDQGGPRSGEVVATSVLSPSVLRTWASPSLPNRPGTYHAISASAGAVSGCAGLSSCHKGRPRRCG